jgi:hypothetical protein
MANLLNNVPGIDSLSGGDKGKLLDMAKSKFSGNISSQLGPLISEITKNFNVSKYLNF